MYNYSLGLYEKALPDGMTLREKLECTRDCGFDHMELCVDTHPVRAQRINWTVEQQRELRHISEDCGVPITTFSLSLLRSCPFGLLDEESNRKAFNILKKGTEIAVSLGARVMLINGYDVYSEPSTEQTRVRFMQNLPHIAEICERAGLLLGVENAEQEFCLSVARAREIVDVVPSAYLGIYADMGNSANAVGGDTERALADIRCGSGKIFAMHIKDTLPGEYRFVPYGSGQVDFTRNIALAKELRVRLFTAELFMRPNVDPVAEAKRVNAYIRQFF